MGLFLSSYINKIDKKGRVSVPASFRAVLSNENYPGIVVYDSFINECIEASGFERLEKISSLIDQLEPFSEERDALATSVLSSSIQLSFDPEGRVILPLELIEKIGLEENACFVGKGQTFEIWKPEKFEIYKLKAKEIAKNHKGILSFKNFSEKVGV